MRTLLVFLFALSSLAPLTALAETGRQECPPGEDCTVYRFDADPVDGRIQRGGLDPVTGHGRGGTVSLLRVRTHFIPELVKTVENI